MAVEGENKARFTPDAEHVKHRYRSFFVALHGAAKRWPGGITELAHITERNPVVLADKLNPNLLDKVPTLDEALRSLELVQSPEALNALALLAGRVTVPVHVSDRAPHEVVRSFLALVERTSSVTSCAAEALADGRVDADERGELLPLIDALIAGAVEFSAVLRGG